MTGIRNPNESHEYRAAREELLKSEIELRAHIERVAALRRMLPPGGEIPEDYTFDEQDASGRVRQTRLSQLFGDKTTLFVYSFMFGPRMDGPCPMCSSVIDGLNANAPQIERRIAMAVVARSSATRIADFAATRGWNRLRLLSSAENSYNTDYHAETEDGRQHPMVNVFTKSGDGVRHYWGSEMYWVKSGGDPRHADMFWPLWNVLDTTPDGRGDYYPPLER